MSEKKTKEKTTNLDYKSFSAITEIEEKYPVYDLEFKDGTKIWNPLRIYLYFYILEAELRNKDIFYKKIFNMLLEGIKPIHIPKKHYTICAFSSGRNRRLRENHYYDIMMDPINEAIDKPMLICEWPGPNGKHRIYDKPLFSKDMTKIQLSIYQKAFWKLLFQRIAPNINPTQSSKELFYNILTHYATKTSSDVNQLITDVEKYIAILPTMKQFFNTFLQQITPSIVLLVGGHSGFNMALIQACKEQQIPTVELQHGLITRYHAAYIKQKKTSNYDYRPDYLFTYGDYFTNLIQQNHAFPAKNVITVGYPYLNKMKKKPPIIPQPIHNHIKAYEKNILITSQWNIAEEVLLFVKRVSSLLQKSNNQIGIIFKPHPSDWREYNSIINQDNICIARKYDDVYELFKVSDVHSTVYSTSALEALSFSMPNLFIDVGKRSVSDIFDIVDNKSSFIVNDTNEYLLILDKIFKNYKKISEKASQKAICYFQPNPEQFLPHLISNILKKNKK